MLSLARIFVLIDRGAVEAPQSVRVAREMPRHPIENHAQAGLMAAVHEITEVVRGAKARGGCVVARYLLAPGAGKRMLHDAALTRDALCSPRSRT